MSTCFFIGHRDASEEVMAHLAEAVERHIVEYGVTEFVVGHYGAFEICGYTVEVSGQTVTVTKKVPF